MLTKADISFRTPVDWPAPHAYQAEILIEVLPKGLAIQFQKDFIERDLLDKEEIEAEGFTTEDDFKWSGQLPEIWKTDLIELTSRTTLIAEEPRQLYVQLENNGKIAGRPEPEQDWTLFTEQLMQACLEAGGKELPMDLVLGKLEKNNFYEKGRLIWTFENKVLESQSFSGATMAFSKKEWEQSQEMLKNWIETEALEADLFQLPTQKGWFWLLNGEVWLPPETCPKNFPGVDWLRSQTNQN